MTTLAHRKLVFLLLLLVLPCGLIIAQQNESSAPAQQPQEQTPAQNLPFKIGEKLTYDISFKGVSAGTAVIQAVEKTKYNGQEVVRLVHSVQSKEWINTIYKVENKAQSYIQIETLQPLRFDNHTRSGSRQLNEYVIFEPEKKTAKYYRKRKDETVFSLRTEHKEMVQKTQDPLSLLYYIRQFQLEKDKWISVKVCTGRRICELQLTSVKEKKLEIEGVGKFTAVKTDFKWLTKEGEQTQAEGLFASKGKLELWLDKETKIPLVMYAEVPLVGVIRVVLSKIERPEK
jgi:hypothetical protein